MLPEIAAEALHFLSRRDIDRASAVSKWLDAMIVKCCEVFPLRPVASVALYQSLEDFVLEVRGANDGDSETSHSFRSMDEAAHFVGCIVRNSYVEQIRVRLRAKLSLRLFRFHCEENPASRARFAKVTFCPASQTF